MHAEWVAAGEACAFTFGHSALNRRFAIIFATLRAQFFAEHLRGARRSGWHFQHFRLLGLFGFPDDLARRASLRHAVFGFETRLFFTGQRLPDQRFNRGQLRRFIGTHKGHRHAAGARAAGTANTVHIVLRHDRQINVDHQRQVVDIQPARSYIGGYQHMYFAPS